MTRILISSFRLVNLRAVLFIYSVLLILALLIAVPFYFTILSQAGHSMALDKLVPDFDFAIFSDFMRQSGRAFRPFFFFSAILSLAFMIVQVFFSGGLVSDLQKGNKTFSLKAFLKSSASLFPRYAGLFFLQLTYLLLSLLVFVLLLFVFLSFSTDGNELTYVYLSIIPLMFISVAASFIMTGNEYAKNLICRYQHLSPASALHTAFSYVFRHLKTIVLFWIILAGLFLTALVYLLSDALIGMGSAGTIVIMLILQQCFIFARIFFKTWSLAAATEFLKIEPIAVPQKIEFLEESPE
jgi:hypothetical protein